MTKSFYEKYKSNNKKCFSGVSKLRINKSEEYKVRKIIKASSEFSFKTWFSWKPYNCFIFTKYSVRMEFITSL